MRIEDLPRVNGAINGACSDVVVSIAQELEIQEAPTSLDYNVNSRPRARI